MPSLEERIADLEASIKRFEDEYAATTTEDKRLLLLQTITAARETLNRLLKESGKDCVKSFLIDIFDSFLI